MKIHIIIVFIIGLFVAGCIGVLDTPISQLFVIPKGHHSSVANPVVLTSKSIMCEVVFDESAAYKIPDADSLDINKLIGIGSYLGHHKNSIRIGWRWSNKLNKIELFGYNYIGSERTFFKIKDISIGQVFSCYITVGNNQAIVSVDEQSYLINNIDDSKYKIRYILFPYFGGNKKSPHNINIYIKFL